MDATQLDRLVRRAGSVMGTEQDSMVSVAEKRTLNKALPNLDNTSRPLHSTLISQSVLSNRLLSDPLPKKAQGLVFIPLRNSTLYNTSLSVQRVTVAATTCA